MSLWPETGETETMKPRLNRGTRSAQVCLAVAMLAGFGLEGCASKPQYAIDNGNRPPMPAANHPQAQDTQAVRSSTDPDNSWGDAVMSPLEDLNLKREAIPPILQSAIEKPYDLTGLDHCEAIAAEVGKLDALLGKDFDEPPPPKDTSTMAQKGGAMANNAAVGAVRGAARSIIPFRGLVRQMTGADAHQKAVDTAISAGKVRRAYLKGVGMNKNCAPPAAPSWFKPRVYVDTYVQDQTDPSDTDPNNPRKRRKHK